MYVMWFGFSHVCTPPSFSYRQRITKNLNLPFSGHGYRAKMARGTCAAILQECRSNPYDEAETHGKN